jgi:predicted Zn finger-like uncharacterized protein
MNHFTVPCPHCESVFPVDPAKVPDEGVRARCTTCGGIFLVEKPAPEAEAADDTARRVAADAPAWEVAAAASAGMHPPAQVDEHADAAGDVTVAEDAVEEVEETAEAVEVVDDADHGAGVEEIEASAFDAAFDDEPFAPVEVEEVSADDESAALADDESAAPADDDAFSAFDDGFGDIALDQGLATEEPAADEPAAGGAEVVDVEVEKVEPVSAEGDDWVIETEEPTDTAPPIEVAPLDTVEAQVRGFQEETFEAPPEEGIGRVLPGQEDVEFSGYAGSSAVEEPEAAEEESPAAGTDEDALREADPVEAEAGAATPEIEEPVDSGAAPPAEPETAPEPEEAAPAAFRFGRRDPHEKAKRLARVLVSDMITYNADRHARALEAGTIPQDFEEEISKSWTEYVDQVGAEMAQSTDYWRDALNEVLAKGEKLF